jgi:GH25 family lysozyme M1 (1,4-beta-N-acetylmuramidase)
MGKIVIDVSEHQGKIDWEKVKPNIDAALLRVGYGSDIASQDDKQWARNVSECERLGIPWGAWLYSYANTPDKIQSEIAHIKRLLSGHKPSLPVFYDLEVTTYQNIWRQASEEWCRQIRAAGYIDGLYSWAWGLNKMTTDCSSFWAADYGINDGRKHRMPQLSGGRKLSGWQYTSRGHCPGIYSSGLDVSEFYVDYAAGKEQPVAPAQKPSQNIPRLDLEIQCLNRGRSGKKYGNKEANLFDDAVTGVSIGVTGGSIEYRVHKMGGGWFGKIHKCDWATPDAYAGDLRSMIDGLQIYFKTDPAQTGGKYYRCKYSVKTQKHGWLPDVYDTNWESGDGSHTAGIFGDPIIGIRAEIV